MPYEKLHESNELIELSRRLQTAAQKGEDLPHHREVRTHYKPDTFHDDKKTAH